MLHVNRRDGFTVAVSENKYITPIAKRSIISDDALSPLIPVLEEIVGLSDPRSIRALFESHGLQIQEWDKVKTDWLKIGEIQSKLFAQSAGVQFAGAQSAGVQPAGVQSAGRGGAND